MADSGRKFGAEWVSVYGNWGGIIVVSGITRGKMGLVCGAVDLPVLRLWIKKPRGFAMQTFETYEAILEFGVLKERQANRFYLAMAQRVADEQISRLFEELAAEELQHKANLELELMKAGRVVDTAPDTEEIDNADYIISDSSQLDMDFSDVLDLAVAKEDAAFRLYIDMAAKAKSQESRDMLLAMAQEEVRHKMRFETERDKLTGRK